MIQPNNRLPPSLKEMMFASCPFKFAFWSTITCIVVVIVLSCILPAVNCRTSYSCSYYYSSYYYSCTTYGVDYCCLSSYRTCGDSYCMMKPTSRTPCWGILITIWVLSGLAFILTIVVLVMFCNIRSRRNQLLYLNPQNYNQPPLIYAQPVDYYQPQQYYQQGQPYQQVQEPIYHVQGEQRRYEGDADYNRLNQQ